MNSPIVIPAFRRAGSLARLLRSLLRAHVPEGVRLVIAVDRAADPAHAAANQAVRDLTQTVRWPHGPLDIIHHEQPLGLTGNTYFCHAQAAEYGAVVVLEDDLIVGRPFYAYAQQALAAYGPDPRLAGIALNTLWFNGYTHQPFIPLPDAADTFFLQLSTPQGQVYTADMWHAYAAWLAAGSSAAAQALVHPLVNALPDTDWLKDKIRYLAATGRYYAFPRESQTVSFGDAGTHFDHDTAFFQVPLQDTRTDFRLGAFDDSLAVYDSFYEMDPERLARLVPDLAATTFSMDLLATKSAAHIPTDYVITTRPATTAVARYAKILRPMEANIIHGIAGEGLALAPTAAVDFGPGAAAVAQAANDLYFNRGRGTGRHGRWFGRLARPRRGK